MDFRNQNWKSLSMHYFSESKKLLFMEADLLSFYNDIVKRTETFRERGTT